MNLLYPEISVVIPVKNEAFKIRACIEGILSQSVPVKEIIVVDSGSTDGTLEILQSYNKIQVVQISSDQFNHGETRNLGVQHATGEFVVLTVGDAKPYDNNWIKNLLDGFTDPSVAAVCGLQVVANDPDKNPVEWFRPRTAPQKDRYQFTKKEFAVLSPYKKKSVCGWDDVTAMYRLSVLKQIPFQRTSYCEDAIWAKDALLAGYALVYNPAARVYHYHLENKDFTFKRSLTGMYFQYKHFGYSQPKPKQNLFGILKTIKIIWQSKPLSFRQKIKWFYYNQDQFKAIQKAYKVFNDALEISETKLETVHEKFCGKPPVPVKAIA